MLIDTGSLATIDMTYTLAADIYRGDVSSQVYEFLWQPRPCLFLDAEGVDGWERNPTYRCWPTGHVLRDAADLAAALAQAGPLQPASDEGEGAREGSGGQGRVKQSRCRGGT